MKDYTIDTMLSEEQIEIRIKELAKQITSDYKAKSCEKLTVVCVLKGAFIFCADLIRNLDIPVHMEFIKVSSYGMSSESSGELKWELDVKESIEGKDVLLIEDIVDTGLTLTTLMKILQERKPNSLKLASLLYKPARIKHPVEINYLGFEIEDKFVVGYGLDYAQNHRELPFVGIVNG